MGVLPLVGAPRVGQVVGAREVLAEVVRGAHLQRLAVHHHALDRGRVLGARKLLAVGLATGEDWNRAPLLGDTAVAVEHLRDFFLGLRRGLVKGMALLPEELASAQEESRAQLPTKDVVPLVGEY